MLDLPIWPAVHQLRQKLGWNSSNCPYQHEQQQQQQQHGNIHIRHDEQHLISQLGYIPTNVIQVVVRVGDLPIMLQEYCLQQNQLSSSSSSLRSHQSNLCCPVVIQLYPLKFRQHDNSLRGNGTKSTTSNTKQQQQPQQQQQEKTRKRKHTSLKQQTADKQENQCCCASKSIVEPFPTMFWLTHPLLRQLVSQLEVMKFGMELEQRLISNDVAKTKMMMAHSSYARTRNALLTDHDQQMIQSDYPWITLALDENKRGIAGIRNPLAVKCLHAHIAHYLSECYSNPTGQSNNNIIGQWVMETLEQQLLVNNKSEIS
jgi:hypothetical protein